MERCTDKYGNMVNELKIGSIVESDIAIFTVGNINVNNGLVSMDKYKPYRIKNDKDPMASCIKSGYYAVAAPTLVFGEL